MLHDKRLENGDREVLWGENKRSIKAKSYNGYKTNDISILTGPR
jgi:hypothetical protein